MLTLANMRTNPSGRIQLENMDTVRRDTTHMDVGQLTNYLTSSFTGRPDFNLLPKPFWFDCFSMPGHVRVPQPPSDFFAELYVAVPNWASSEKWRSAGFDFDIGYRDRLQQALCGIIERCLKYGGKPNVEHLQLAHHAYGTIGTIRFTDGPDSPERQLAAQLSAKGSMSMDQLGAAAKELNTPPVELNPLYPSARQLREDLRYRSVCVRTWSAP